MRAVRKRRIPAAANGSILVVFPSDSEMPAEAVFASMVPVASMELL